MFKPGDKIVRILPDLVYGFLKVGSIYTFDMYVNDNSISIQESDTCYDANKFELAHIHFSPLNEALR